VSLSGVVVITGTTASGKSTVAQALAKRLPRAAHVRGDAFRRMIVSGRAEYTPGAAAVVQDVLLGPEPASYVERIRTRPLHVVVLAPSPEAVAKRGAGREAGRPKTGYGPAWTIAGPDAEPRLRTEALGPWPDTSALTVEQTVAAIVTGTERARAV
jgi:hypothetical protein